MSNDTAGNRLTSLIERLEELEEARLTLVADIREVKKEAAGQGFDLKVISAVLKRRRDGRSKSEEFDALVQLYEAALGDLGGTPLGDAARRRMSPAPEPEEAPDEAAPEPPPQVTPEEVAAARLKGAEDARAGLKILANPFHSADPRRAAWDEGWCGETGTDGMELPEAWRRKKPPKKGKAAKAATPPDDAAAKSEDD